MTKVPLSDGGWLLELPRGDIIEFDAQGREVERVLPGDVFYDYRLSAILMAQVRNWPYRYLSPVQAEDRAREIVLEFMARKEYLADNWPDRGWQIISITPDHPPKPGDRKVDKLWTVMIRFDDGPGTTTDGGELFIVVDLSIGSAELGPRFCPLPEGVVSYS